MRLDWRREFPTVPGLYVFQPDGISLPRDVFKVRAHFALNDLMLIINSDGDARTKNQWPEGWFYGPLPGKGEKMDEFPYLLDDEPINGDGLIDKATELGIEWRYEGVRFTSEAAAFLRGRGYRIGDNPSFDEEKGLV